MAKTIRIAIAGLGTVGQGVVDIVTKNAALLAARTGDNVEIKAVHARSRHKDRDVDISRLEWMDDPIAMAMRPDIDVIIELIGGEDGVAKAMVEAALGAGKHVITANKALIAHHGTALAQLAEAQGVALRYEAAVAGGIPIIKALGEGLAGNQINRITGLLNGTTNYILSRMEAEAIAYETVFADAQALGYLEADPSLDVGGIDAAHKLAILTALGMGSAIDFAAIEIEGIETVSLTDIVYAGELGYRIKLLCVAERVDGGIIQRVAPALLPKNSPLGSVMGVTNKVVVEGDHVGRIALEGPGAGRGATASAVIGDLTDIARGLTMPIFGMPVGQMAPARAPAHAAMQAFYVRLTVADRAGTLAAIAGEFAKENISIDQLRQLDHDGEETPLIIVTHETTKAHLDQALSVIEKYDAVMAKPVAFRIERG